MIYHIRKRLQKQNGNQFYKDQNNRYNGTYCGADATDHDITWNGSAEEWGEWKPCQECMAKRYWRKTNG